MGWTLAHNFATIKKPRQAQITGPEQVLTFHSVPCLQNPCPSKTPSRASSKPLANELAEEVAKGEAQ